MQSCHQALEEFVLVCQNSFPRG